MKLVSFSFSGDELQKALNDRKDDIIERINRDHGLAINPAEYLWVLRQQSCLGRIWNKLLGWLPEDQTQPVLVRIKDPPTAPVEEKSS
jgi:hypothetical protein